MTIEKQLSENELFLFCCCASQSLTALQLVTWLIKLFSECLIIPSALLSPGISGWALPWLMPQKHNCSQCSDSELTLLYKIQGRKGPACLPDLVAKSTEREIILCLRQKRKLQLKEC